MSTKLSVQCLFKHRSKFAVGDESNYVRLPTACVFSMCRCCTLTDATIYKLLLHNVIHNVRDSSIYIDVRRLYTMFYIQRAKRELDDVVMTVRQRVTSVLENESFIIESIETQLGHLNCVEDVVGGLERVKFSHGVHFLALQNC